MKLIAVEKSTREGKKWMAVFYNKETSKKKIVHFGASGMADYTIGATTKDQREKYLARHAKRENWNDPMTPAALSRWILWGDSRSMAINIGAYKKRFNL